MSVEDNESLAFDLAALGYPGLSYLKVKRTKSPAEVLFSALSSKNVGARLVEARPWVLLQYPDLDWRWLREARLNELQNKLGFLTSLARRVAEASGLLQTAKQLREWEAVLERARLLREETLCHDSLSVLKNVTTPSGHWLALRLVGNVSKKSPRDAISAIVYVTTGKVRQRQDVISVDKVEINWPDGVVESVSIPGVDHKLTAIEGKGIVK